MGVAFGGLTLRSLLHDVGNWAKLVSNHMPAAARSLSLLMFSAVE